MHPVVTSPVIAVEETDGPGRRRDVAVHEALSEVAVACTRSNAPVLALRAYPRSGLVVALGGRFDLAAVGWLRARIAEIRALAADELVILCSSLDPNCHGQLPRALARLRMQCLIAGTSVYLLEPPTELMSQISQESHTYTVVDNPIAPRTAQRARRAWAADFTVDMLDRGGP